MGVSPAFLRFPTCPTCDFASSTRFRPKPWKNLPKILLRQLLNTDTVFVRTVYLSYRSVVGQIPSGGLRFRLICWIKGPINGICSS
jgi:hypothetical protein